MSDNDDIPEAPPKTMPAWVMTFADLMSLLMCFFVLLLSFSEMDLKKFKQVAGSMERAFGVQRQIEATETPRGTSIIAQEFSTGRPDPTPLNEIRQQTTKDLEERLKIESEQKDSASADETTAQAQKAAEELLEEIRDGLIELETKEKKIVIRILEKGSFSSGSANLRPSFLPVLQKIGDVLSDIPGNVTVAGFTDNIPIQNDLFRSNWELSAIRAFVVVNELLKHPKLPPERFMLAGNASNRPIAPNNNPANRAKNRRVELIILQGENALFEEDEVLEVETEEDAEILSGETEDDGVSPFPTRRQVTKTGGSGTEKDNLGIYNDEALYDYEVKEPEPVDEGGVPLGSDEEGETQEPDANVIDRPQPISVPDESDDSVQQVSDDGSTQLLDLNPQQPADNDSED